MNRVAAVAPLHQDEGRACNQSLALRSR
jgi:hypothetical protein